VVLSVANVNDMVFLFVMQVHPQLTKSVSKNEEKKQHLASVIKHFEIFIILR